MRIRIGFFAIALVALVTRAAHAADCRYDEHAMMTMTYDKFDEDPNGWRILAHKDGCMDTAADLIAKYRRHVQLQVAELAWHEGQLRAIEGQTDKAIVLFESSRDGMHDEAYVDATIAFLKRDHRALLAARARLAALPKPDGWEDLAERFKRENGRTIVWPMNLDVVDGLIACFDKSYKDAYGGDCQTNAAEAAAKR